jgi:hypothetical protein
MTDASQYSAFINASYILLMDDQCALMTDGQFPRSEAPRHPAPNPSSLTPMSRKLISCLCDLMMSNDLFFLVSSLREKPSTQVKKPRDPLNLPGSWVVTIAIGHKRYLYGLLGSRARGRCGTTERMVDDSSTSCSASVVV